MEEWRKILGFENYSVSNLGRVKNSFGKILSGGVQHGYRNHDLRSNGVRKNFRAHQLVAMAFLNHNPNGMSVVVDHINENKLDNRVDNLQLVDNRFNVTKSYKKKKTSSKYTGVSWDSWANKWKASIRVGNSSKSKHIGRFDDEYEAHLAYEREVVFIRKTNKNKFNSYININ